jgi:hypothetical protein
LRQHVMADGNQVLVEGLYRGNMLVHTEEDWRTDYRAYVKARLVFDVFTIGTLGCVLLLATLWFIPLVGVAMIACVIIVCLTEVLAYRVTKRVLGEGGALPGIYEEGVEMPLYPIYAIRLFIPWSEMEDAWVKRSRMMDDLLYISVRNSRWRWRFPGRLLGEEGMQAVISRARATLAVHITEPVREAPRLVVYSSEGAKTESVPEEG